MPDTLLVSLGSARTLNLEERQRDGDFRETLGYERDLPTPALRLAACGWWRAGRTPSRLVALAPGGFVIASFLVNRVADYDAGGFQRYELGDEEEQYRLELNPGGAGSRVLRARTAPGPVSRWAAP